MPTEPPQPLPTSRWADTKEPSFECCVCLGLGSWGQHWYTQGRRHAHSTSGSQGLITDTLFKLLKKRRK